MILGVLIGFAALAVFNSVIGDNLDEALDLIPAEDDLILGDEPGKAPVTPKFPG